MQASHIPGRKPVVTSKLVRGDKMRCPNCEQFHHLFWYVRLEQVEKYAMETNPIYRCPTHKGGCGHVFSPGDRSLLVQMLTAPAPSSNGSHRSEVQSESA